MKSAPLAKIERLLSVDVATPCVLRSLTTEPKTVIVRACQLFRALSRRGEDNRRAAG
jgi:hypothetical protein